jgi:hypothetical protein
MSLHLIVFLDIMFRSNVYGDNGSPDSLGTNQMQSSLPDMSNMLQVGSGKSMNPTSAPQLNRQNSGYSGRSNGGSPESARKLKSSDVISASIIHVIPASTEEVQQPLKGVELGIRQSNTALTSTIKHSSNALNEEYNRFDAKQIDEESSIGNLNVETRRPTLEQNETLANWPVFESTEMTDRVFSQNDTDQHSSIPSNRPDQSHSSMYHEIVQEYTEHVPKDVEDGTKLAAIGRNFLEITLFLTTFRYCLLDDWTSAIPLSKATDRSRIWIRRRAIECSC